MYADIIKTSAEFIVSRFRGQDYAFIDTKFDITAGADFAADAAAAYHTVAAGDTLWAIGAKYGKSVQQLLELNKSIANPNRIFVGQKVRVR